MLFATIHQHLAILCNPCPYYECIIQTWWNHSSTFSSDSSFFFLGSSYGILACSLINLVRACVGNWKKSPCLLCTLIVWPFTKELLQKKRRQDIYVVETSSFNYKSRKVIKNKNWEIITVSTDGNTTFNNNVKHLKKRTTKVAANQHSIKTNQGKSNNKKSKS